MSPETKKILLTLLGILSSADTSTEHDTGTEHTHRTFDHNDMQMMDELVTELMLTPTTKEEEKANA
jgi:hypothetical protein